jgi:integrase
MARTLTPISVTNLRARATRSEIPDGGCRGLYLVVQSSGFKSWVVRYRFRGRPRKLTLGPVLIEARSRETPIGTTPTIGAPLMLADARWLAAQVLREVRSGVDPGARKQHTKHNGCDTVRGVGERFLKQSANLRSIAKRRYDLELIFASLGDRLIADVKRSDLVRLLDNIESGRGPAAADRVAGNWRTLATWHSSRVDDYRPLLLRGAKRNKRDARTRVLSDGEIRHIWTASLDKGPFGACIRFLLLTATRREEAVYLRRSELVDPQTWIIPAARYKTKRDTLIPLSRAARAVINELPRIGDGDFVFTNNGRQAIGSISRAKRELDEASGVGGWVIHDLRRTARTLLSRAGIDADIAERCLGHALSGVRAVYDRHAFEPEKRRAFEALAAQIERILNPPSDNVVTLAEVR